MSNPNIRVAADIGRNLPNTPFVEANIYNQSTIELIEIYRENLAERDRLFEESELTEPGCPSEPSQTELELHLLETFQDQRGFVNKFDAAMDIVNCSADASLGPNFERAWQTFINALGLEPQIVEPREDY
jgi:hypothetical protein